MRNAICILLSGILFWSVPVFAATTYYVSVSGNDASAGLGPNFAHLDGGTTKKPF